MRTLGVAMIAVILSVGSLSLASPAAAATGFHVAYFSESSFLTLGAGQTGQFSVGFTNTGTEPFVKGSAGREASLHTAAPLDNPVDFAGGWASGWKSQNVYAAQSNDLVAPGQVVFFIYNVVVPASASIGTHTFYGRPSVDGVGFLEDYGYFQVVNVQGSLTITSITPASPSSNNRPTVSGTGATPSESVNILDGPGGTIVGTATADAQGAFSVTLTTALSNGTHTIVAQSFTKGSSAGTTYVVNATLGPTMTSIQVATMSQLVLTFNTAMKCAATPGRNDITNVSNFFVNVLPGGALGPAISTATASTDCTQVTLNLASALVTNTNYSLIAYFIQDTSGNTIQSPNNTITFSTFPPSLTAWVARQDGTLTLTFSEPMSTLNGAVGSGSVLNPNNYQVDTVVASTSSPTISCVDSACSIVRLQFPNGASSVLGAAGTVHTITISNVTDANAGGQLIVPNPTTRQLTTQS